MILGRQGSGKGTQCTRLARHYVVPHISTGDMLRLAVKEGSELGIEARKYMDAGRLLPDVVISRIIADRLDRDDTRNRGFVLDGFPRTVGQAEALSSFTTGIPLDVVINLEVPVDVVLKRIAGRRVCADCGTNYSVAQPPRYDWTCDVCGGRVVPARRRHRRGDQGAARDVRARDVAADRLVHRP